MLVGVPTVEPAVTKAVAGGNGSLSTAFRAMPGPRLVTVMLYVRLLPTTTGLGAPVMLRPMSASGRLTVVATATELLPGLRSVSLAATFAVALRVPPPVGLT